MRSKYKEISGLSKYCQYQLLPVFFSKKSGGLKEKYPGSFYKCKGQYEIWLSLNTVTSTAFKRHTTNYK